MIKELHGDSTAALLRELAGLLEKEQKGADHTAIPDFFFCVVKGHEDLRSASRAVGYPFSLLGLIYNRMNCIERECIEND